MTTTPPTPEQFLAQPSTDEDDLELEISTPFDMTIGPNPDHPLNSIAASLRQIVDVMTGGGGPVQLIADLEAEVGEVEALAESRQALIDEVLAICKPSVGKLAIAIRAVLEPPVGASPTEPDPEPSGRPQPAHDAELEEWRAFALEQGCTVDDLEGANRSRIRTLLGISQTES